MKYELDISGLKGLSDEEAGQRLKTEGHNELPAARSRSVLSIAAGVLLEPMFLLLVASGSIYLVLGDIREAVMLLGFVFVIMGITLYQERKTERALEALRDLSSPRALVLRDTQKRIPGREVARGDLIVLCEGDRVSADATLISCVSLSIDESLLTGESGPVRKSSSGADVGVGRPGGDDRPFVYSGTLVVQGFGVARVHGTGVNTELGKIGKALKAIEPEKTILQKETARVVRGLAASGLLICAVVVVAYGLTAGVWLKGILAGITLAMAILPEEFPVVLTVFLALGAWRISRNRALTRHVPAVETLGSATVLCVDKTGTLTLNRMSVQKILTGAGEFDVSGDELPDDLHEIIEFSILASQLNPFDPMEKVLRELGAEKLSHTEHLHDDWSMVQEYPLSKNLMTMSRVWISPDSLDYVIAAKGAPEAIADICHMDEGEIKKLEDNVGSMAARGLRVIGVAKSEFTRSELPASQHDFKFIFLGLIGFADPVRPGVEDAIAQCRTAGIRVVMITGDYPATAQNVASRLGLAQTGMITGAELDAMDDIELGARIRTASIFARVVPEQKLRIVNAFKSNGEVVAMTGDGVNDAPALKAAHIGIAMGGRGTDVARESADIVLLDDDFSSIVGAVKTGRRIFDNLKKAMAYILAVHIPIAGMSLLPVLFGWPLVLLPMHIVFLELIIDPACSVVFEAEREEPDIMARPPRNIKEPLFGREVVAVSVLQGLIVLLIVLAVFAIAMYRGLGELDARALSFTSLIFANLGLILTNLSWSRTIFKALRTPNKALWWVVGGAMVFLGIVLYVPYLRGLFHFSRLHLIDLAISFSAGVFSIFWFEGFKMLRNR